MSHKTRQALVAQAIKRAHDHLVDAQIREGEAQLLALERARTCLDEAIVFAKDGGRS